VRSLPLLIGVGEHTTQEEAQPAVNSMRVLITTERGSIRVNSTTRYLL